MFYCDRCTGEFNVYRTPGKCPLCDQWVTMECTGCGHSGPSIRFIEAGGKCPKCRRVVKVPGRTTTPLLVVAGLLVLVLVFAILVYLFATLEPASRPLPDIPKRAIETPT